MDSNSTSKPSIKQKHITLIFISLILYSLCETVWTHVRTQVSNGLLLVPNDEAINILRVIAGIICFYTLLVITVFGRFANVMNLKTWGIKAISGWCIAEWLLLFLVMAVIGSWLQHAFHVPLLNLWHRFNLYNHHVIWFAFFWIVCIAPILEELLFRGVLFGALSESSLGPQLTLLITSYLWATPMLTTNLYAAIYTFVVGLFLGLARLRSGSVLLPIILHLIYGCVALSITVTLHFQ